MNTLFKFYRVTSVEPPDRNCHLNVVGGEGGGGFARVLLSRLAGSPMLEWSIGRHQQSTVSWPSC